MPLRSSWSYLPLKGVADTDERYTPDWALDLVVRILGAIDLDPCADPLRRIPAKCHFTKEQNGLEQPWSGKVFVNPPYSGCAAWLKHLCIYVLAGTVTESVLLVPVTALGSKGACLLMREVASAITLLDRVFTFLGSDYKPMPYTSPVPLALVYVGENIEHFFDTSCRFGYQLLVPRVTASRRLSQCVYCGRVFAPQRSTAKFCGSTCRKQSHRRGLS